jgi:hypothetical protein
MIIFNLGAKSEILKNTPNIIPICPKRNIKIESF